jgi:hypothetical protein
MTHLTLDWIDYNGDYEKEMQDIMLKSGEILMMCWPNAGKWSVLGEHDIREPIPNSEVAKVRLTHLEY